MSASGFTVNPEALRSVSKAMVLASATLNNLSADTHGLTASDLGHRNLEDEVRTFVTEWTRQATKLSDNLFDFARQLRSAADNYQKVEDAQIHLQGGRG